MVSKLVRTALVAFVVLPEGTSASQPTGHEHGAWSVVSIASLSGDGGGDASALIVQENEAGALGVHWAQGGSVVVSARIKGCDGEEDFHQFYSVDADRWVLQSKGTVARRLAADFSAWLDQARLVCREETKLHLFRLGELRSAAHEFSDRLRYFMPQPARSGDIR